MRTKLIVLLLMTGIAGGFASSYAEEPLFDTKAAAAHVEKGIGFLHAKKYDSAISELENAVSIAPNADAYYYLGYAYYEKGRNGDEDSRKKAIECFDQAYELDPSFTPSRTKFAPEGVPGAMEPGVSERPDQAKPEGQQAAKQTPAEKGSQDTAGESKAPEAP